jgi:competence protein ComEC
MFRIKNKIVNRKDGFLWSLPFLILLGFLSMKGQLQLPKLDQAFEKETTCELSGIITMIVEKKSSRALYVKDNVVTLPNKDPYVCENIIIYCKDNQTYLVGNRITVLGTIQKFSEATNPGQFNERMYYKIENIDFKVNAEQIIITDAGYSKFHAVLGRWKSKLIQVYDTLLSEKESGALIAMLLGEKYLLKEEIKNLYQQNGISHVLAISGLHVSLIGMFLFYLLKKIKLPIPLATFLTIFFIYSYGVLTNFSVSTNRAVVMMTVMLLSALVGKTYDMLSAMALSAFLILLQNPLELLNAGFLLSFGAVLGIALILPCLQILFPSKNAFLSGLYISVSAQAATTPMVLFFYYQLPLYGILTNLIILPFITILTLTSILAGIVGLVNMQLGIFVIGGSNYILKFYEFVCRIGSNIPGNLITIGRPNLLQIFAYSLLLILFIGVTKRYGKKYFIILLVIAPVFLFIPRSNVGLEITMLDVGQGEAIFMEAKTGTTYLIDGGSASVSKVGTYRILPFLKSQGVGMLDYAIITHSDSDHISGLKELIEMEQIAIQNLVLPNIAVKDDAYLELEMLAKEKGIKVQFICTGDVIMDGDIKIVCLHPIARYEAKSSNAYSTVLSVSYGEFDMLLTGDLEKEGEIELTKLLHNQEYQANYTISPAFDYDILKVAHHGSKYSTSDEFLSIIRPEIALISCGEDNNYGHPHKELMERLKRNGCEIKITYEKGAILIKTDGKKVMMQEYLMASDTNP